MNLFSFYFSGSPLYAFISIISFIIIFVVINNEKGPFSWKQKVLAIVIFIIVFVICNFNIGTRQSDLNRKQFNAKMTTDQLDIPVVKPKETINVQDKFDIQLNKSKEENTK